MCGPGKVQAGTGLFAYPQVAPRNVSGNFSEDINYVYSVSGKGEQSSRLAPQLVPQGGVARLELTWAASALPSGRGWFICPGHGLVSLSMLIRKYRWTMNPRAVHKPQLVEEANKAI